MCEHRQFFFGIEDGCNIFSIVLWKRCVEMKLEKITKLVDWDCVKKAALATIHKRTMVNQPTSQWKRQMLLAEHSPIRMLQFLWTWEDMKHFVTVHYVRHHEGCEKFVSTQRTDRTGIVRDKLPQDEPQDMMMHCNAQALINISRKRLCNCASAETRAAWLAVKDKIAETEPEMASVMVRECVYRGFCPEMKSCGFDKTDQFKNELAEYRKK